MMVSYKIFASCMCALFILVLAQPATAANETVGNWTFNEGAGTWANDTSGFNNNGTITGATWATNLDNGSVNGTALSFNNINSEINIGTSASLNIGSSQSFSMWLQQKNTTGLQGLLQKGTTQWEYSVQVQNGVLSYVIRNPGSGTHAIVSYDIDSTNNNTWIFLTGTYSNNSFIKLYKNGIEMSTSNTFNGNTAAGADPLYIGNRTNNFLKGVMDEVRLYNYALNQSEITALYQQFQPAPAYPVGGISIIGTYPPLTSTVNFTWHDTEYPTDRLVISKDSGFNTIIHDNYYTSDYANIALEAGTYYWKIQQYNSVTSGFGDTSATQVFTITSTTPGSDGTTGIQGIIYESKTTGNVPLSGTRVMLSNLTHFMETTTGSNGYFIFTSLANNSDYILQATKKNYDDSAAIPVQTVNGTWAIQNIYMTPCTSSYTCNVNQQFVKFTVQTLFGTKFPNVEANVYLGSDATATYTDTTDAVGAVNFWLIKDQKYRLTFINSTQGINREMNIVASDTEYLVIISGTGTAWQQYTTQAKDAVFTNVTKSTINSTYAYINTSYLDTLEQTTALTVYINQTNASDPYNQTVIQSWTASAPMNDTSNSFIISGYSGQQYLVHYVITHSTYGTVHATYSVSFTKDIIPAGVSRLLMQWFAIIFMVMTGAAFTASTAELGLIVVAVEGWIFRALGFFNGMNIAQIEVGLTIVTVLGVISYIVMKNKREGYA